jgi:hypothetical protein
MVMPLRQGDPRWGSQTVGNGGPSKTYAAVGCVTTAMTVAVNALRGTGYTPDALRPGGAAGLTSAHYTGASMRTDLVAPALGLKIEGRVAPGSGNRTPEGLRLMLATLDNALARGGLVLVRVDYDLSTEDTNHTVTCFARDATGYKCVDPGNGDIITLSADALFFQRSQTKTYAAVGLAPIFRA